MTMKDKARNLFQISRGRAKQVAGSAVGDVDLGTKGRREERAGDLKQAGEKVKDAFRKR
ncbi:MAG TPA: CsbD family protein [Acidimicrobiales bacterium]|nr:CsbD family protein [Acidimicrobiales bacterium]